jgi:serine/threonine-protein kinase
MLAAHGLVKITDFGIARAGEAMTITGQVVGTPNYMSPEQVLGKTLDGRSDLFSVGVMLYEMITGERPFEGQSITTIMYKIVHETPIPPRKLDSTIHPGLSAVIEKSLAKAAEERFPNGAELARALQNYESATVIPTSTLGQPTGDFPGLVDSNRTHDPRSGSSTAPPAATPPSPQPPSSAPQTRIEQARHFWQQLSPKTRKRLWVAFVLAAIFIYSKFEQHPKRARDEDGGKNQNTASSSASPAAPSPPATPATEEKPSPQQGAPALVKRENAGDNQSAAVMKINSNPPSAEVDLDGKPTGKRTPAELQIGRGRHRVSVRMPGFQTSSVTVKVAGGEEWEYSPDLAVAMPNIPNVGMPDLSKLQDLANDTKRQSGFWQQWAGQQVGPGPKLVINSTPPGASILIDGKDSGHTSPAVIPVKPGKYHVRLQLDGFQPAESDVIVTEHKAGILNPKLTLTQSDQ